MMTTTHYDHASAATRYRALAASTGIDAYAAMAGYHASMVELPGEMHIMAIVAILQRESESRQLEDLRSGDPRVTAEMPVLTMADLVHGVAS